jgi:hypothetical protein
MSVLFTVMRQGRAKYAAADTKTKWHDGTSIQSA